jgi:hypothetical protein
MDTKKKELRGALKSAIKGLIMQKVRIIQLEQSSAPLFILEDMVRSIEEAKREVIALVRQIPPKERETLLKSLIRQSVNEEIDQAIRIRQKRCFRCIHVRYFDRTGSSHSTFPVREERVQVIGCEITPTGMRCQSFAESPTAISIGDYLEEVSILYDVKAMFEQFERIWENYLTK